MYQKMKIVPSFLGIIAFFLTFSCNEIDPPSKKGVNPDNLKNIPGWFYSDHLLGNRFINIRLPQNYDRQNPAKYHTIYLLDGNWYFYATDRRIGGGGVSGIINQLVEEQLIPDVILVGIGNSNPQGISMRGFDFHSDKTGDFLNFLTKELIPAVDQSYNTDTSNLTGRTLIGHSSAAYFTMLVFFQYDSVNYHYFCNFISLSGDFNKPLLNLFDEEKVFFNRIGSHGEVNMALFLAVGSLEEDRFLNSFNTMRDRLISRNYEKFRLGSQVFQNHDHGSYLVEGIRDGLTFLLHE